MAYVKVEWENGETPLNETNLNIMDDGIKNLDTTLTNLQNDMFFGNGDSYTYTSVNAGGCITGSKQSILFTIPLPKFAIGLNATINSGTIYARGVGGYLLNGTDITAANSINVQTYPTFLTITLVYPAFSSATNNTPVAINLANLNITFATAS